MFVLGSGKWLVNLTHRLLKGGTLGLLHYFGLIGYNIVNVSGGMSLHLYFFFFWYSFATVDSHLCAFI